MGKGNKYKVGYTRDVGRRRAELAIQLPEPVTIVHELESDDPEGIEHYWHQRFKREGKHLNGERFLLSSEDVAVFKRRGRFM